MKYIEMVWFTEWERIKLQNKYMEEFMGQEEGGENHEVFRKQI